MVRNMVVRMLLVVYAVISFGIAAVVFIGRSGLGASWTTSGRILGAAIVALALGALIAARDPWQHRSIVQVLVAFTTLSSIAILYRMFLHGLSHPTITGVVLMVCVACAVLLVVFYPRPAE